jgi:hypothetical protein
MGRSSFLPRFGGARAARFFASLRNQQSIAFVNVSPELDGSMSTDRQKLHQHKLASSDASEESFFRAIRPIN